MGFDYAQTSIDDLRLLLFILQNAEMHIEYYFNDRFE